jgi:hypothetical protein
MKSITHLDDQQCATLSGGFWGSYTNISMTKFASSYTGFNQTNSANNTGIGLLVGLGNAQSLQGNAAEVFSVVF